MSLRALDWCVCARSVLLQGPHAKLIFLALANEADDTGTCCSSDQLIADLNA
jgi:hypothetical protein